MAAWRRISRPRRAFWPGSSRGSMRSWAKVWKVLRCVPGVQQHHVHQAADHLPELTVPGMHNRINASMALAAAQAFLGRAVGDAGLRALAEFAGLPHRLQQVAEQDGVRYFNDSKCTTPEGTIRALEAFAGSRVHLIAGGYDKGGAWDALGDAAAQADAQVWCLGATGAAIADAVRGAGGCAEMVGDLETAMARIQTQVQPGDVVLLSPGAASWDQFTNYEARGTLFCELVTRNHR